MEYDELDVAKNECTERQEQYEFQEGYCNVTWDTVLCWNATPAGAIASQHCPSFIEIMTESGFATRECGADGLWVPNLDANVTTGWTNFTDCFKKDPVFVAISNDLTKIELMSNIGYGISLASLIIAVLIMFLSRRLHCKSNSLHLNLFIAFILRATISFVKDSVFVRGLGLEKDVQTFPDGAIEFKQEGTHWECKLLVTIFMYTVTASLMWIFMEGLYLHMLVYKTLFTERTGIRMYVLIGWLSPFTFIIPWILVRIYLDNTLCWNVDYHSYMRIITVPTIVTILINFAFFVDIVRVLCIRMKTHRNATGSNQQLRKLAKFSLVLIPLFGVLYIGFAAYPKGIDIQSDMIYLYCEMFYNSFQGLILAVLFCFLNEEVHNEVRRCWYRNRRPDNAFTRTFTLSSYRKGSSMSHTSASVHRKDVNRPLSIQYSKDKNENPVESKEPFERNIRQGQLRLNTLEKEEEKEQICPLIE